MDLSPARKHISSANLANSAMDPVTFSGNAITATLKRCSLSFQFISLVLISLVCQQDSCAYTLQQLSAAAHSVLTKWSSYYAHRMRLQMNSLSLEIELHLKVSETR